MLLKRFIANFREIRMLNALRAKANSTSHSQYVEVISRLTDRKLVFAISSGRSGTHTISALFAELDDTISLHEPEPNFQSIMRFALREPALARAFLVAEKLPKIASLDTPLYVETSHVFGKAFLPPLLDMGLRPRLIITQRDARAVAKSFERINSTPFKTKSGRSFLISPGDPNLLPLLHWDDFTDYQLCYWYALENTQRQSIARRFAEARGCICVDVNMRIFNQVEHFIDLFNSLELGRSLSKKEIDRIARAVSTKHNTKEHYVEKSPRAPADYDNQEFMVIERIREVSPCYCLPV